MDANAENQLRLLSIFHYVLAGLGALFSLFPVIHIVMGVGMLSGAFDGTGSGASPPRAFGWMFIAMGAIFMLAGATYVVLLALAGRFLALRRHWTFCIVVAALSCAFFPFGTALGVFTILALSKDQVKAAFEAGAAPTPAGPTPARPV